MNHNHKITCDPQRANTQSGMILVSIMSIMIFLSIIFVGMFSLAAANLNRAKGRIYSLQAQYAAESGADEAIARFNGGNDTYTGTTSEIQVLSASTYRATYTVAVTAGADSKEKVLTAVGRVYSPKNATTSNYKRTIRVIAQRSSSSVTSSVVSRNILALDTSVKTFYAKDIYVNGYITIAKNSTDLIAENIISAGKNTGSTNCSISGIGNLVKPSAFTTAGQTKTNITTAYNNCISPPGNSSNANFSVNANMGTIGKLQSTYIPWSQYMDSSYGSATNGCSDWSSGSSTQNIPKTNGSKLTHYPDSGANVSSACGTSGDLNLGSTRYNLNANAHIRASLCAASACSPTFYNPDSTIKYLFVEGTVNFNSVQTVAGSGPIVLVVYGADPASKNSICPYGGAAYLGGGGTTSAPALYMLATNGVCLDKTKFSTDPALGGISGKNIYIATNSGSPHDLKMDTSFPVNQIPIDLTWRAVRYLRL
ncbi:MAG: hypothetical protein JWO35_221 [Candidatus Saccharibacteria bacterium]|nr:hypothetical protein [Candidatus Saccharibacteria bacterium]